jgi:hypothetical protein
MLPMLAGCDTDQMAFPNEKKPVVRIPVTCERMAAPVNVEAPKARDNAKAKMFEYLSAVGSANDRLDATRTCQEKQRKRFARG